MPRYVVLKVMDDGSYTMPNYAPQVATIQESASCATAAAFNVGNYPDADARGKPYRVVVIEAEHFHEYEVFHERIKGKDSFVAYPSEHPTMIDNHE